MCSKNQELILIPLVPIQFHRIHFSLPFLIHNFLLTQRTQLSLSTIYLLIYAILVSALRNFRVASPGPSDREPTYFH